MVLPIRFDGVLIKHPIESHNDYYVLWIQMSQQADCLHLNLLLKRYFDAHSTNRNAHRTFNIEQIVRDMNL